MRVIPALPRYAALLALVAGCTAPLILAESPQEDMAPFGPGILDASHDGDEDVMGPSGVSTIDDASAE